MIFAPAAAFAGPPGPPPPPPGHSGFAGPPGPPMPYRHRSHYRYWHDDDDDWGHVATGLGIAILLGTLIYNSHHHAPAPQQPTVTPEQQKKTEEVRTQAKQNADAELKRAVELAASHDLDETLSLLEKRWQDDGRRTSRDVMESVAKLKVSGFVDNILMEYDFDQTKALATVSVTAPDYQVSEESSGPYHVKPPLTSLQKTLGFDLSDKYRAPSGGIEIRDMVPGSRAAQAGIAEGSLLLKVDAYDVKNFDCGRISSYIEGRAERAAAVKLSVSHAGKTKVVKIQL
jgi:C-terminal processing protease CtpA/Prc